jgi:hypothetical protein
MPKPLTIGINSAYKLCVAHLQQDMGGVNETGPQDVEEYGVPRV